MSIDNTLAGPSGRNALLRNQVDELQRVGLSYDEAIWVANRRLSSPGAPAAAAARTELVVAFALALLAAFAIKVPELAFGLEWGGKDMPLLLRNVGFLVLPFLVGYFAWKRRIGGLTGGLLATGFLVAAVFANAYPFSPTGDTLKLTALHLPIALWLLVGLAHAGSRWREPAGRMDFVRFSGELLIYYVLIAMGGSVFIALNLGIFQAIGVDAERAVEFLLPCGMAGAVIVAAWLVETKQRVMENMAPVLTQLFTPLFAIALLVFLGAMAWTGRGIDVERNALIVFDLLLALVLGLLLYSTSARETNASPSPFDKVLVLLLVSALVADAFALAAIVSRITELGFTPNRTATLGFNLVLLVNLAGSAVLYGRFLRGSGSFAALERWQTGYLPVYSAWAAIVVIAFPPIFGFR
jgi:hypothetical protein